jgi:putative membrane protein
MQYGGSYMMGGMHGMWWLFWLALVGVLLFTGWGRSRSHKRHANHTPHEMLHRRLASGEITPAEYEECKALLDRDAGA